MKKLLFFLIAAILILPGVALAQGESLSRSEINRISNSVVLILALDANGEPFATGSGTIISPNGLIYTNRHVLEGAMDFAVLTVAEIGEPAVLSYFASPTLIYDDIDFAVLQIDRDADGNEVDTSDLSLPYISLANTLPDIGDRIFVFGYPTLGDVHLVMTSGSISSVENDTLNGERLPYWYQTDAQISPGNSGGLVVNSQGRMIGIPTRVRSEDRTLGRLGAILSVSAVRSALDNPANTLSLPLREPVPILFSGDVPLPQQTQEPNNDGGNSNRDQEFILQITNIEHNSTYEDQVGMIVHASLEAIGHLNVPLRVGIFAYWDDGTPMSANNRAHNDWRSTDGQLTAQLTATPTFDDTIWDDMTFFIPYDYLPEGRTGTFTAYLEAQVGVDGEGFTSFSNRESFDYTYPDQQLIVDITSIDQNVEMNGTMGIMVHSYINTIGYKDVPLAVGVFFYWQDGSAIDGSNAPADNRTHTGGYLTEQGAITPSYDNSEWTDYWFFVPYDYFPTGLKGEQNAFAEVDIGVDGQGFTSWSRFMDFTLFYS